MNGVLPKTILKICSYAAVLFFCILVFSDNKADVDLWGNVGFVTALPWSPAFHYTNTFSFTEPEHQWINHEWLAEYIFNKVYLASGSQGLIALKVLLGIGLLTLLSLSVRKECRSGALQFLFIILAISTIGYGFSFRPHLFTYLMLALFLYILRHHNRNASLILSMPVFYIAWTNLHGAFFIGIALLLIFISAEFIKSLRSGTPTAKVPRLSILVITLVLLAIVSFFNPYGASLWRFIFESAVTPRPYLSEWAPFNPVTQFADHTDFMALSLISIAAISFSKRRRDVTWLCILLVSFLSALTLRRNIPVFAIVSCFVIPAYLDDIAARPLEQITSAIPRIATVGLLAVLISVSAWHTAKVNKTSPLQIEVPADRFPTEAAAFIRDNHIRGNMLVFFDWAEYCIWNLPGCKVFFDGRFTDAYSRKTMEDYLEFLYAGKDWTNAICNYPTDIILLHRGNTAYSKMCTLENWRLVYEDPIAGLFLRTTAHSETLSNIKGKLPAGVRVSSTPFFP